ncbi:Uncharacterized conserved protein [Serratia fonticola]|uniref:Uncharacterized conserved protein n=1 Tax=Serratia fonticola TaxID=47917 RepID=A0A448SP73_SERFO|nr:Uncharacterized conserved protein [Serratia fonticola]
MAALKSEVKAFIIQSLACFDTPSKVAESVKSEFGLTVSRQQVESHDPTKAAGKTLAQKWVKIFYATRERFQTEISDIAIANKAYRLRVLDRMATSTEKQRNFGMTAQLMEQAAKEVGDVYTNRQQQPVSEQDKQKKSLEFDRAKLANEKLQAEIDNLKKGSGNEPIIIHNSLKPPGSE